MKIRATSSCTLCIPLIYIVKREDTTMTIMIVVGILFFVAALVLLIVRRLE